MDECTNMRGGEMGRVSQLLGHRCGSRGRSSSRRARRDRVAGRRRMPIRGIARFMSADLRGLHRGARRPLLLFRFRSLGHHPVHMLYISVSRHLSLSRG
jgi:hypothetical protein